jgi:hypothetical protein
MKWTADPNPRDRVKHARKRPRRAEAGEAKRGQYESRAGYGIHRVLQAGRIFVKHRRAVEQQA